jgi:hypothetical protein
MMHGHEKALSNTGCPWPGGATREFSRTDVLALGKLICWGSACTQFIARLVDGTEVFVRACDQGDDEKWLRKIAKRKRAGWANRSEGWRTTWIEVIDADR